MSIVGLVEHLRVDFGARQAVRDVSFELRAGEVLAVLGPNGAGKSTTLTTLLGFRTPTAGRVELHGRDPHRDPRGIARLTGALLQDGGVWAPMGPREVLRLTASYYDAPRSTDELIERLGLGTVASTAWRRLSGGERQRTLLALALIGRPSVLVLDEPTSGVDPDGRDIIRDLVREERDAGRTIVVSTHELDEAQRVADRVCVIAGGRDVLSGRVDELTASSELRIVLNREPATVAGLPRGARIEGTILVGPAQDSDFVAAATAWLAANDVTISSMSSTHSLESVYRDALREARS